MQVAVVTRCASTTITASPLPKCWVSHLIIPLSVKLLWLTNSGCCSRLAGTCPGSKRIVGFKWRESDERGEGGLRHFANEVNMYCGSE
jgi:hypothetical protein